MSSEQILADQIEKLIDDHGLAHFLSMSGFVCGEKAERVATQLQDARCAKAWMDISVALDKLTAQAEEGNL